MKTTLNKIRKHGPCLRGWQKLLKHLNKTKADDEPLSITTILDSNGLDDALWCLRAVDGRDKEIRLYAVWCARQAQHLMTDERSIKALDVSERYAHGEASEEELAAAWYAASGAAEAAYAAARGVARDAAWYAAMAAANAARTAASAAAVVAVRAARYAAYDAAKSAQARKLREICKEREAVSAELLVACGEPSKYPVYGYTANQLAAAILRERERCAQVCETWRSTLDTRTEQAEGWAAAQCAEAIRKGEQK